jgi:hypothetical protein
LIHEIAAGRDYQRFRARVLFTVTVVKSPSRKFALFLRGKGERKAHTYDMCCYQHLIRQKQESRPIKAAR